MSDMIDDCTRRVLTCTADRLRRLVWIEGNCAIPEPLLMMRHAVMGPALECLESALTCRRQSISSRHTTPELTCHMCYEHHVLPAWLIIT